MCFGTAIGLAGAATSAVGAVSGGFATAANANYQGQVARNNAIIANQNADYARKAGIVQAQTESLKAAQRGGQIKAAQAANGVDVNSGSALDVQESQREQGQLDTETTEHNALLKAYGYRTQTTNFEADARLRDAQAGQAEIGGFLGAAGGLAGNKSFTGLFSGLGSGGSDDTSAQESTHSGNVVGG